MKKAKKQDSETPESSVSTATADGLKSETAEAQSAKPYPDRAPSGDGVERITFKVVNGKIDPEGIRKSNESRFREVIQQSFADPKLRDWAKVESGAIPGIVPPIDLVPPILVGDMLDLAVNIESLVLSRKTGMPYAEVRKILAWSIDEHERLDKQGARLIAKYVPVEWLEKIDLWLFIGSLVSLSSIKIQMLNAHTKASFERTVNAQALDESKSKPEPTKQPEPPKPSGDVDALSSFKPKDKPESNGQGESFG